jgi:hypothetical protein
MNSFLAVKSPLEIAGGADWKVCFGQAGKPVPQKSALWTPDFHSEL